MKEAIKKALRSANKTATKQAPLRKTVIAAALISASVLAFQSPVSAQSSGPNLQDPADFRFAKGRLLVQPRAGLSIQELDKKLRTHGARRVGSIPKINVYVVELPPQANEMAVLQRLKTDRHIKFVELDRQMPPSLTPNDPNYTSGWHLPKIGAPSAWDYSVGTGVTIAILDTGVDASHPDLATSIVPGYNAYDGTTDTHDVYGHGTKVAGAAAMVGNDRLGGTGVSFTSKIMPVRVTDTSGYSYFSTMARGLVWAADHGARVANMSYSVCGSSTVLNAVQYLRNKGGVATGAAGNAGTAEAIAPSDLITCVSATDSSDALTSWSSYGSYVDIAAPGAGIYTTTMGGGYGSVSGTSFSAPVTAGVYALMISANPALAPSQLDDALFSTAADLGTAGYDEHYGNGRIDASAAVTAARGTSTADTTPPSVTISSPVDGSSVSGLVTVDVDASDNIGVARVDLYAGGSLVGSDSTPPYQFSWDSSSVAAGQVSLQAKGFDAAGNVGASFISLNVGSSTNTATTSDTTAPSVAIGSPSSGATITASTTIAVLASDNNQVAKISLMINGKQVAQSSGSSLSYSWDPYAKAKGKGRQRNVSVVYTISATATDAAGNSSSVSENVFVQ